jgi:hypothetical protein
MTQLSYSRLWGAPGAPASRSHCPLPSDTAARQARDRKWAELRSRGIPAHRFTLHGQVRQYWELGVPCGQSCRVFKIDIPRGYDYE